MPTLPSEQKKKPDTAKIQKAKQQREQHDAEWFEGLRSPQHFAKFLGFPEDILGAPPEETVETAQEARDRARIEARERKQRLIQGLRAHREKNGNVSLFGLRQDNSPVSH